MTYYNDFNVGFFPDQIHTSQGEVQALAEVTGGGEGSVAVDLNSVTEATLGQDGQIILTGEDGHGKTVFYRLCTVAGQELLEQWFTNTGSGLPSQLLFCMLPASAPLTNEISIRYWASFNEVQSLLFFVVFLK